MAYFVGIYWSERKESRQSCANRISVFLRELAVVDDAFSKWFKKSTTRNSSLLALPDDPIGLLNLMKAQKSDIGGEVMSDLGFNFSAWNGLQAEFTASLSTTCGAYSRFVQNSVAVSFDERKSLPLVKIEKVLRAAVVAFDPDHGVMTTTESLAENSAMPAFKAPGKLRYTRSSGYSQDG